MIIVMKTNATDEQIAAVEGKVKSLGLGVHLSKGAERTVIGAIGDKSAVDTSVIESLPGVLEIVPISKPYKLVCREIQEEDTVILLPNGLKIGGKNKVVIMAGPCSVENEEMIIETAKAVKEAGAHILRGGAFKPRTSPYSFQGLGETGLKYLAKAREITGLPVITEVMDTRDIDLVVKYADILQIGARNMQNFVLLKEVGKTKKPIFLKRGPSATMQELLMSAEYIMSEGNKNVILCERGIKTMENYTRNTLDLSLIPVVKKESHLPIIADPSHGTGLWRLVAPMSRAAIAAGADGLMIEVHPDPSSAKSDGQQSLTFESFKKLMSEVKSIAEIVGRG